MLKNKKKTLLIIPILLTSFLMTGCSGFFGNLYSYLTTSIEVKIDVTGVELDKKSVNLSVNNSILLNANIKPTEATNKNVSWKSENPEIASVDDRGLVSGKSSGKTTITCTTSEGGFTDSCEVTVSFVKLTNIEINRKELNLLPGASATLDVNYIPSNASERDVVWTSNETSIANVTDGVVKVSETAKAGDKVTITAKSSNSLYSSSCEITVIDKNLSTNKAEMGYTYQDLSSNKVYRTSCAPSDGEAKFLVIPVWFKDSETVTGIPETKKEEVRDNIEKVFFGTQSDTGWNSVKSFYEEESYLDGASKCKISGKVSEWYECSKNAEYYYTETSSTPAKTDDLVKAVTNWYFENHSNESRKDYDKDGDGYLDAVVCVYAAPDYQAERNTSHSNMWAYCYWSQTSKNLTNPVLNAYLWASYDFMYGQNKKIGKYFNGDCDSCLLDAHTYIHETGHLLGLSDYYDYSKQYKPAGCFSMQDCNIGGHDPYSVLALGWAKPYIPNGSATIKISPFQSSHDLILLTPNWNDKNSPFDEYILLEYYTPTGLNKFDSDHNYGGYSKGPSQSGIRVWHVDSRLVTYTGRGVDGKPVFDENSLTYDMTLYSKGVELAMSNTYYSSSGDNSYLSNLGVSYANYNLLQLIRNNKTITHKTTSFIENSELFKQGDSFDMKTFKGQFVNTLGDSAKLNNGKTLGYSFKVVELNSNEATIEIVTE